MPMYLCKPDRNLRKRILFILSASLKCSLLKAIYQLKMFASCVELFPKKQRKPNHFSNCVFTINRNASYVGAWVKFSHRQMNSSKL